MKKFFTAVLVRCLRWWLNLVVWVYGFFLGPPPKNANGGPLDSDLHALFAFYGPFSLEDFREKDLDRIRSRASFGMRITGTNPPELASVKDRVIDGSETRIPIRIYDPDPTKELPGCVFYHGGGFVLGDLNSHDGVCRFLARNGSCRVVSVDYRLAPEHPFPAAVVDAVDSFQWVHHHASDLKVDPDRIAVAGDSAGATLATVVCQNQIEQNQNRPAHQLLLYPSTDHARDYPSRNQEHENILLTWDVAEWFGEQYISDGVVDSVSDHRISPLRFERLDEMPPAIMVTAGFDPLRDEGVAYVERLEENGVEVRHHHYEHLVHGFATLGGISDESRRAMEELISGLRKTWDEE